MASSLMKDREQFMKRQADATDFLVSNEKRQKVDKPSSQKTSRPKSTLARSKTSSDLTSDYHSHSAGSQPRLLKRTKIIEKLQERYLGGQTDPVTLDEIIQEANLPIDASDRHWLASDALLSNEKIDVKRIDDVNKFVYKPPLNLKAPKKVHLLNLLKSRHEKCEGPILVDDIRDTIPKPRADAIIDGLIKDGEATKFTSNKREVLFYTDREYNLGVNPGFIEEWRKISVEGIDDEKLLKFLNDHGHYGLTKNTPLPTYVTARPSRRGGRRPNTMKHNEHVASQLMDFSSTTPGK